MRDFLKIAHRGASGYQPGNTSLAFATAIALNADAIEFDVRRTQDGELVVAHDSVRESTLGKLRQLDLGKGQRIQTLAQVCETFGKHLIFNIELKESGIADRVLEMVKKYDLAGSVIVSSFARAENGLSDASSWNDLFWLKSRVKRLKIALLAESRQWAENAILSAQTSDLFPVYALNLSAKITDASLVRMAREKTDCKIFVWTCDDPEEIQHFKKLGVDGIFSDYPDRLQDP